MKRLIPLLALAVVLSGCTIRFDSRVTVDADESGTYALEISLDEEFRELAAQSGETDGFGLEEGLEDVPSGWSVTEFTDGEFEGFRVAVDFDDFADLDRRLLELTATADADSPAPTFLEESGFTRDGDRFDFTTTITGLQDDLTDLGGDSGEFGFEGFDPASIFEQLFQIRFVVTLPGTIGANNADSVDGNTLIWNIAFDDEGRTLEASSDLGGGGLPVGLIVGILAIVALAVIGFVVYQANRRRRQEAPVWMGEATTPLATDPGAEPGADPFGAPTEPDTGPSEEPDLIR